MHYNTAADSFYIMKLCSRLFVLYCRSRRRPWGIFFGFYKTHFAIQRCKLHRATCRRFDTIPACGGRTDRQTDGRTIRRTDGIAVAAETTAARRATKCERERRRRSCETVEQTAARRATDRSRSNRRRSAETPQQTEARRAVDRCSRRRRSIRNDIISCFVLQKIIASHGTTRGFGRGYLHTETGVCALSCLTCVRE